MYIHNSFAHLKSKNIFLRFMNALAYYNTGVVAVNLKVVGLGPGLRKSDLVNKYLPTIFLVTELLG
jgi:hypothetical protein